MSMEEFKICGCGTWGYGSVVALEVLWEWLDSVLECFSNLYDSMILHLDNTTLELESVGNVTWL